MSRDRLAANDLTDDQARDLLNHVARERLRWGKHYTGDDIGLSVLMDALIQIAKNENQELATLRAENEQLKKELTAARKKENK